MVPSHRNRLEGQHVKLSGLCEKDAATIADWRSDTRFLELWNTDPLVDRIDTSVAAWIRALSADKSQLVFGVRVRETSELVGIADLSEIEWPNRVASLGLGIGNPAHWGRGWGTETLRILVDYAFTDLNLYRLQLTVLADNDRAIRLYERIGFQHEGTFREFRERDGGRFDMLLYGLLLPEWQNRSDPTTAATKRNRSQKR
jgi:RimJ/RimL family protein N-acetyltransferase